MKTNALLLNFLSVALLIAGGCKKVDNGANPTEKPAPVPGGKWSIVNISGQIDSTSTLNGVTKGYSLKTTYDSVQSKIVQVTDGVSSTYSYNQTLELGDNSIAQIAEKITQLNSANVLTNYSFSYNSYWSLLSNIQTYHGLNILNFERTHIFGNKVNSQSTSAKQGSIQYLLSNPSFGSYDLSASRLVLYLHLEYAGNPDVIKNGVVTNPDVKIVTDYVLTYKMVK